MHPFLCDETFLRKLTTYKLRNHVKWGLYLTNIKGKIVPVL